MSLAERFGGRTVTREIFAAMVDDVAGRLASFDGRDRLSHLKASPNFHLLGTSGTVTTLAGVHLDLERYDRRRVDGLWMDRDSVDRMVERLVGWDFQQRCANPCIGAGPRRSGAGRLRHPRSDPRGAGRRSGCVSPTAACAKAS